MEKKTIGAFAFVLVIGLALMAIQVAKADFYNGNGGTGEDHLTFGTDDIGEYAYFSYVLSDAAIIWLSNQPEVIDIQVDNESWDPNTQVWFDSSWFEGRHLMITYHDRSELRRLMTKDVPGDCGIGYYTKDIATGQNYIIYMENGQLKTRIDDGSGCLG